MNGLVNFDLDSTLYWNSTEHDDNTATATNFSNRDQDWTPKQVNSGVMKVRAVRYF